ncbi:hypothetical protein CHS0354_024564, partial [Potamilus streckersoni]
MFQIEFSEEERHKNREIVKTNQTVGDLMDGQFGESHFQNSMNICCYDRLPRRISIKREID